MKKMDNLNNMDNKNGMENMDSTEDMDNMEDIEDIEDMDSMEDMGDMDELLKAAFAKIVAKEYENRPMEFPKHEFSAEFEHNMEELLRTGRMREKAERKNDREFSLLALLRPVRSKKAVLAMVVLMVVLFGATASGTNPIIVWLHDSWMEQHGDYVEIENREEKAGVSEETFQKYKLTEVPEGYKLKEEEFDKDVGIYFMTYVNAEGNVFVFRQNKKDNGNLGNVTANRKDMEQIEINGLEGYYIKDSDAENLILSDGEYMLVFTGNLSKEEFLRFAEGLKKEK